MALKFRVATEDELAVDKLHALRQSDPGSDEMDVLADQLAEKEVNAENKEKVEKEAEDDTTDGENQDDTETPSDDTEGEQDGTEEESASTDTGDAEDGDGGSAEKDPGTAEKDAAEGTVAKESFLSQTAQGANHLLVLEQHWIERHHRLMVAEENIGHALYSTFVRGDDGEDKILIKLKDAGIHFSGIALKHMAKGVLYALNLTLDTLVSGSKALVKYVHKRRKSLSNFEERIKKAEELITRIESSDAKNEPDENKKFEDVETIGALTIGANLDVGKSIQVLADLCKTYQQTFPGYLKTSLNTTRQVIKLVMTENAELDITKHIDKFEMRGFKSSGSDEFNITFEYQHRLPGNRYIKSVVPHPQLTQYDAIKHAYHNSKTTVGMASSGTASEAIPYLDLDECKVLLKQLSEICELTKQSEAAFIAAMKERNAMKPTIGEYIKFLSEDHPDMTIKDSLAEFVSLKLHYADSVIIAGQMHINDMIVSVVSAGLHYVKESLKQYVN